MNINIRFYRRIFSGYAMRIFCLVSLFFPISVTLNASPASSKEPEWSAMMHEALQSGRYVMLLRHALAPGTGDPDGFDLKDCKTQRNLSEQGRQQARRIGKVLKANGIQQAAVFSSQWCRCLATARLLDLGEVAELPMINSFFQNAERKPQQMQALKQWLVDSTGNNKNRPVKPIILVTHQVNITALTSVFPRSGGLVIVDVDKFGRISVKGQIETGYK